jgi:hypothetical protein
MAVETATDYLTTASASSTYVAQADIGSTVQAYDAGLAYLDGLNFTDEATFKAGVNLEIGTDVQAYDADTTKNDVANTFTANQTVSAEFIATSYNETVGTITSSDLDLETGNVFNDSISANTTYTFSNPPASGTAYGFTLKVTVSGTRTITWPASVDWAGGSAPDAPAAGETDVFAFYTTDGGTTYYGFLAGDAMA